MGTFLRELEGHLSSAVAKFKEDIQGIRSGRPTTQLVENIEAEYAGQTLPLRQLASLSVRPPREIVITVWDKEALPQAAKAIEDAKIGLNISTEGNVIRAFLPPLSEERRTELTKLVKKISEEARIKVRNARDEVLKKLKNAESKKELTKDDVFQGKEKIQEKVDEVNKKIEEMVEGKMVELRE